MPCTIKSVPAEFVDKVHLIQLHEFMSPEEISTVLKGADQMEWNSNIPGGFVQNIPQRKVNSFGDGSGYDSQLKPVGEGWDNAYWTPAVHQADSTLVTPVEPLPDWLKLVGVRARNVASEKYGITMDDHAFNLAVCNKYIKKTDEIAAHTDDNEWYVKNLQEGPMFASLTLYPNKKPTTSDEFARFELFIDGKWCNYTLPHASLLLMPSCIPHRVRPCVHKHEMFVRVNVTLRSVPSIREDAFNSMRGMSNHARYYRLPSKLIVAQHKDGSEHIQKIKTAFNDYISSGDHLIRTFEYGRSSISWKTCFTDYKQMSKQKGQTSFS